MVGGIALGVAVLICLAVLGFCGYELRWRSNRLQGDLAKFHEVSSGLQRVAADVRGIQARIAAARGSAEDR